MVLPRVGQHELRGGAAVGLGVQLQQVGRQLVERHAADARGGACGGAGARGAYWLLGVRGGVLRAVRQADVTAAGRAALRAATRGLPPTAAAALQPRSQPASQPAKHCTPSPSRRPAPVKQARTTSAPRPRASKIWLPLYEAMVEMPILDMTLSTPSVTAWVGGAGGQGMAWQGRETVRGEAGGWCGVRCCTTGPALQHLRGRVKH